jgi:hypothetical protein
MIFLCYASLKVCGLEITPENSNMGHVAHGTSNPANAENLACHGSRKLDEEYFTWAWFAFMHFKHQESSHACGVYAANSSPGAQNQSKGRDVPCDDSKQMRRQRMVQCRKERRRKRSFANLFWACARGPSKNMPHLFAIVAAHVRIGAYLSSYSNVWRQFGAPQDSAAISAFAKLPSFLKTVRAYTAECILVVTMMDVPDLFCFGPICLAWAPSLPLPISPSLLSLCAFASLTKGILSAVENDAVKIVLGDGGAASVGAGY